MKIFVFFILIILSTLSFAEGFTAICEAEETHAYRNSLDASGRNLGSEWSDDEKFFNKWTFVFNGGEEILLNGIPLQILFWDGTSLIAIEHTESDTAVSTWTYAFNLKLKDVVGSQVNSYRILGTGIKARSTNFDCDFSIHAN